MKFDIDISDSITEAIGKSISRGVPFVASCKSAGISYQRGRLWMEIGEKDKGDDKDTPYARFYDCVNKADGRKVRNAVMRINRAAKGGQLVREKISVDKNGNESVDRFYSQPKWQADAWLLERTEAQDFSLTHKIEHSGQVHSVNMNLVADMTDAQIAQLSTMMTPKKIESLPQ